MAYRFLGKCMGSASGIALAASTTRPPLCISAKALWISTLVAPNADQCSLRSLPSLIATLSASVYKSRASAAWYSFAAAMLPLSNNMP